MTTFSSVFLGILTLLTVSLGDDESYSTSCIGLEDGYHNLKLINSDSYPIVTQKCSNEYTILDYSMDNNLKQYFSSWDDWHMESSGPSNDEHINWRSWYLPDSNTYSHSYLVSPDCSSCDESANNQLYDSLTSYYMTGTIYGCFWKIKGQHNCDIDYSTLDCYTCQSIKSQESEIITIDSTISDYGTTGICPTNINSAEFVANTEHYDCSSSQGNNVNLKPSIGNSGRFCVCVKPNTDDTATLSQFKHNIKSKIVNPIPKIESEPIKLNTDVTHLYQKDFEKGPYRITESGTYKIMENILFDFNKADTSDPQADGAWWPTEDQSDDYPGSGEFKNAYFMGFFAGITIETNDVTIDLNGKTIAQSELFYYQQRWFTGIEVGTQYFIPGQGVGNFGPNPVFPHNIVIKNGVIGLTSHHGIHGNNNENIILNDLVVRDFETHGIQFNGFDTIMMNNVEVGPTSNKAYFKGEYSHMRAILPRLKLIANEYPDDTIKFYGRDSETTMSEIAEEIETKMNMVWNYVVNNVQYDDEDEDWIDAKELFYNEGGIPYGAAQYGIFLNTFGASVFTYNLYCKEFSENVILSNIKIHNMKHKMIEYVAFTDATYGVDLYINALTAPISYDQVFNEDDMSYKGSIITDAYLMMEYLSDNWYYLANQVVGKDKLLKFALDNDITSLGLQSDDSLKIGCNYDVMIHSGKGINGLRLDGVQNVQITDIEIYDLEDSTPLGRTTCGSQIEGDTSSLQAKHVMHFRQTQPMQVGFSGNMVQAIQLNAAKAVTFKNIDIYNLESHYGQTYGIAIWPENEITFNGDINIYNLNAGSEFEDEDGIYTIQSFPNALPEACAIRIQSTFTSSGGTTYTSAITQTKDISSIKSYSIQGHTGCAGLDYAPTMLGDSMALNDISDFDSSLSSNYDYYSYLFYLLDGSSYCDEDISDDDIYNYASEQGFFDDDSTSKISISSNKNALKKVLKVPSNKKRKSRKAKKKSSSSNILSLPIAYYIIAVIITSTLVIFSVYDAYHRWCQRKLNNSKPQDSIRYTRLRASTQYGTV